ncbi:MAG: CAP domain-containing protein [Leptolyngbyaceae bacterium]|nr:CAP domain-containing protein [Leptolyngbyaceae bacterium]
MMFLNPWRRRFRASLLFLAMTSLLVAIALDPLFPVQAQQAPAPDQDNWAILEQNILIEHNKVRENPASYIPIMEAYLAAMDDRGNVLNTCGPNCVLQTVEGKAAVEEAIAFLRNQPTLDPIEQSPGVAQAAQGHAQDQSRGTTGHTGSDGSDPGQRFRRQGVQALGWGENIAYGSPTAQEVVRDLIIDDGVPSRGHRTNIFKPDWTHAGAGCGVHAAFRNVCVIGYIIASQDPSEKMGDPRTITPVPGGDQFEVINNGTVELRSLQIGNTNILGRSLASGQSRTLYLTGDQCSTDLRIQLGGNYAPLDWPGLPLCGSVLTIDEQNGFSLQYWRR